MAKTNMNQNQVLERKKPTPSLDPVSDGNNAMQQFVAPQVVQTNSPVFLQDVQQDVQQDAQMTEARKSFMSPEQYSRVESNIHGQEDLLNKELRIARREMIAVYQNMVEQGFRSPSFFGVRRRLAKLLAVEEVWEQRVKDPAECEALGIETTNAMHQRLLRELSDSISQYLSNHERKSGKSRHYLERIGLLERLEQHVNTLNSVQGAFGRLQKELNFAYSDSQGYEESMSDDTAVMSLEKHKKRAVVAYTDNDVFFEKEGRKYAKYQCMNGVLRGELSLEEFSKEQRAVLEDDMESLHKTLDNSALEENLLLFRGTNLSKQLGEKLKDPDSLNGCILDDKGYMSTSRQEQQADVFIDRSILSAYMDQIAANGGITMPDIFSGDCKLEIQARKGAHALDVAAVSKYKSEKEVLFAAGTVMYVHDARIEAYEMELPLEAIQVYNATKGAKIIDPSLAGTIFTSYVTVLNVEIR